MANPNIWAPGQAINANSSVRFEAFTASASQSVFTLNDFQYALGTGSLMVFVSGIAQRPGIDFYETSVSSFILSTPVAAGTIVLAMGMVEVSAVLDQTFVVSDYYVAIGGETLVSWGNFQYDLGGNHLRVFRNGLLQELDYDYTETSESSVTFLIALDADDRITFLSNVFYTESEDGNLRGDLLSSGGSNLVGYLQAGTGAVTRTVEDKVKEFISVKDFGAVGDGVADDTVAIQAAIDSSSGRVLYFPSGTYKTTSSLIINTGLSILGDTPVVPSTALADPSYGSWLVFAHDGIGLDVSVNNGFNINSIGTYRSTQVKPIPGVGTYIPTVQAADLAITTNDYSTVRNVTMLNPYIGIQHRGTGGVLFDNILLGALNTGISIDQTYDSCYVNNVHVWPFWTGPNQYTSWNYTIQNLIAFKLGRIDNPFFSNIFSIFARYGMYFYPSAYGSASKVHVVNADFDRGARGIYTSAPITGQFDNITIQGEYTTPAGSGVQGVIIDVAGVYLRFGMLDIRQVGEYAINATAAATSGECTVDNLVVSGYGLVSAVAQAVYGASTGFYYFLNGSPRVSGGGGANAYSATVKTPGWAYTNVTASRASGNTYTNTDNRPRKVSISGTNTGTTNAIFSLDGTQVQATTVNAGGYVSFFFEVPPQSTYSVSGFTSLFKWFES